MLAAESFPPDERTATRMVEAPHLDEDVRLVGFIQVGRDNRKNRSDTHPKMTLILIKCQPSHKNEVRPCNQVEEDTITASQHSAPMDDCSKWSTHRESVKRVPQRPLSNSRTVSSSSVISESSAASSFQNPLRRCSRLTVMSVLQRLDWLLMHANLWLVRVLRPKLTASPTVLRSQWMF